jgi:hypothetical protein
MRSASLLPLLLFPSIYLFCLLEMRKCRWLSTKLSQRKSVERVRISEQSNAWRMVSNTTTTGRETAVDHIHTPRLNHHPRTAWFGRRRRKGTTKGMDEMIHAE